MLPQVKLRLGASSHCYARWHHPTKQCQRKAVRACSQAKKQAVSTTASSPCQPFWESLSEPALWQGTEEEALSSSTSCFRGLSPTWKVLLLSDGSVTRHLQLMTSSAVQVDCLQMVNVGSSTEGLPPGVNAIPGPRVQREVLLRPSVPLANSSTATGCRSGTPSSQPAAAGLGLQSTDEPNIESSSSQSEGVSQEATSLPPPLVYACSWWEAEQVDAYLKDRTKPIWVSLSQGHVELYREVQFVYHGHSQRLEELLQCKGPFWGRQYFFWHDGRPLTLIYEVFSPRLEQFLGPSITCNQ